MSRARDLPRRQTIGVSHAEVIQSAGAALYRRMGWMR